MMYPVRLRTRGQGEHLCEFLRSVKRADPRPAAVDFAPIAAGDLARIGAHDAVACLSSEFLGQGAA